MTSQRSVLPRQRVSLTFLRICSIAFFDGWAPRYLRRVRRFIIGPSSYPRKRKFSFLPSRMHVLDSFSVSSIPSSQRFTLVNTSAAPLRATTTKSSA